MRVAKTRADAAKLITSGHVRVNGRKIAKASAMLREGDVLTVARKGRVRVCQVSGFPVRRVAAKEAERLRIDLDENGARREGEKPSATTRPDRPLPSDGNQV